MKFTAGKTTNVQQRSEKQRLLWNISAEAYANHVKIFTTHKQITNQILACINCIPRSILDFGCGPGNSTVLIEKNFASAEVIYSVDYSQEMISIANNNKQPGSISRFHCVDYVDIPNIVKKPIDLIICSNSFFHVVDKSSLLDIFNEVMGDHSLLVFSLYDTVYKPSTGKIRIERNSKKDELMEAIIIRLQELGYQISERQEDRQTFTEESLNNLFSESKFEVSLNGVLCLSRDYKERLSFFRIPVVFNEVFPNVPISEIERVFDKVNINGRIPPKLSTVYIFVARRC